MTSAFFEEQFFYLLYISQLFYSFVFVYDITMTILIYKNLQKTKEMKSRISFFENFRKFFKYYMFTVHHAFFSLQIFVDGPINGFILLNISFS